MIYGERKVVDDEGFEYKYVPKQQIPIEKVNLPEPGKKNGGGARSRKVSDASSGPKGMVYVRKMSTQEQEQKAFMNSIIAGLKPNADQPNTETRFQARSDVVQQAAIISDDDAEIDENVRKIMSRRVSMNEQNVVGMNFEKYNREAKPSAEIVRKITNFAMEFQETKDKAHAKASFLELCQETQTPRFTFVGYILNNAFSLDTAGWREFLELIVGHLFTVEKLLSEKDLLEG